MPKEHVLISLAEPPYAKGQFVMLRFEPKLSVAAAKLKQLLAAKGPGEITLDEMQSIMQSMDLNESWFWCGRALGWQPANAWSACFHVLYSDLEHAEADAMRYVQWPTR